MLTSSSFLIILVNACTSVIRSNRQRLQVRHVGKGKYSSKLQLEDTHVADWFPERHDDDKWLHSCDEDVIENHNTKQTQHTEEDVQAHHTSCLGEALMQRSAQSDNLRDLAQVQGQVLML